MALFPKDLKRVEYLAEDVIRKFKITKPPINVNDVARKIGLSVIPYNLGDDVSGTLVIENGKGFIGYNPSHSKGRQRFTIAHELGHFHLHRQAKETDQLFVDKDFVMKYRSANNYTAIEKKHEQEANAFAAALLMPKKFIVNELEKDSNKKMPELQLINSLARLFNVSVPAMTFRLTNLNIFF